ncbi:MAG: HEPN domain-containing protein [bacterium]
MDNKDIAKEWFDIADADLASAKFLQKMRPISLEIICYHCQQAAEKYLKGFLVLQGEQVTKTHDLTLLNEKCLNFDKDFKTVAGDCLMLTDYSVNVRYPFPLEITEKDMKLAIKSAIKIKDFVKEKVGGL